MGGVTPTTYPLTCPGPSPLRGAAAAGSAARTVGCVGADIVADCRLQVRRRRDPTLECSLLVSLQVCSGYARVYSSNFVAVAGAGKVRRGVVRERRVWVVGAVGWRRGCLKGGMFRVGYWGCGTFWDSDLRRRVLS